MTRVLLVESDQRNLQRLRQHLDKPRFTVVDAVTNGARAAEILSQDASIDVVVLAWDLKDDSGPDGPALLCEIRQRYVNIPVVITLRITDVGQFGARAVQFGAAQIVTKPYTDGDAVRDVIQEVVSTDPDCDKLVEQLSESIIGESPAIRKLLWQIARIVPARNIDVLLTGERGTGKEVVAQAVHRVDPGATGEFASVNCGAIPANLIEAELFGAVEGAATEVKKRPGRFLTANGGTLLLDEIGDLPQEQQVKLLRALEQRTVQPVGSDKELPFTARVICATNVDLESAVESGDFRNDLYDRIAQTELRMPPLREREGDIGLLVDFLLQKHADEQGLPDPLAIDDTTADFLSKHPFDGNVRDLVNFLKHATAHCRGKMIRLADLPLERMEKDRARAVRQIADSLQQLNWPPHLFDLPWKRARKKIEEAFNRIYFARKLEASGHNVTRAAREADVDTKTLRKKCDEADLLIRRGPLGENAVGK